MIFLQVHDSAPCDGVGMQALLDGRPHTNSTPTV